MNPMNTLRLRATLVAAVLVLCACARQTTAQQPVPSTAVPADTSELVQPGLGTLKQDEFTVGIRSGDLLVKVTPLDEAVIRLAAPDTYKRLHALAESRRADALKQSRGNQPELFMVAFFSYSPDVDFNPEALQLDYNGKLLRAVAIMPLTTSWGKQRLGQQETQAAVYVFDEPIDFDLPLVLRYGADENREWQRVIPKLQVERNKILSRQKTN
jgi:hypothetical protein